MRISGNFIAKYPGKCGNTGQPIKKGDLVHYIDNKLVLVKPAVSEFNAARGCVGRYAKQIEGTAREIAGMLRSYGKVGIKFAGEKAIVAFVGAVTYEGEEDRYDTIAHDINKLYRGIRYFYNHEDVDGFGLTFTVDKDTIPTIIERERYERSFMTELAEVGK